MFKKIISLIVVVMLVVLEMASPVSATSKVDKVVKNARTIYYGVQKDIKKKKLKVVATGKDYKDYYRGKKLVMSKVCKTNTVCSPKKCKAEFYFDKRLHPVFVFAWKKVKGKTKEYRFYYGINGKCYRYIGPDHKVHNYKKGRSESEMSSRQRDALNKAYYNLHLLGYM